MPRHLGRLDVAMRMEGEGVSLKMDTHHEATATIVTAAQGRLVEELRQQGVRVAGAEVTCTPGETGRQRSEEHTSELQSLMRISYAVFCLKKKKITSIHITKDRQLKRMNCRNHTAPKQPHHQHKTIRIRHT